MGYTTDFEGAFEFDRQVEPWLVEYVNKFSETRRMKRDNEKIKEAFPNWKELCLNGNLGKDGEYFVGGLGVFGQDRDPSVLENNYPASTQPGLWCQWCVTADGNYLEWDGGEKFYHYTEWLEYMIDNFFAPFGYVLNGEMTFQGEDSEDLGTIYVNDNKVSIEYGIIAHSISNISDETLIKELINRGYKVIGKNSVVK